jgi:hypothetical protein
MTPLILTSEFSPINARRAADACAETYRGAPYSLATPLAHAKLFEFPDQRLLAWRGSVDPLDWLTDLQFLRRDFGLGIQVHHGFADAIDQVNDQLIALARASAKPLFITGHSLGAAMAILSGRNLIAQRISIPAIYTFGGPRVGNKLFAAIYDALAIGPVTYRIVNEEDIVPRLPSWLTGYRHVGQEIFLPSIPGLTYLLNPPLRLKLLSDALGTWLDWKRGRIAQLADHPIAQYQGHLAFSS